MGADGRHSVVAHQVQAPIEWSRPSRLRGWYSYYANMPVRRATWAIGASTTAGSFPTNDGLACVWSMSGPGLIPRGGHDRKAYFLAALQASSERLFEEVRGPNRRQESLLSGPIRGS